MEGIKSIKKNIIKWNKKFDHLLKITDTMKYQNISVLLWETHIIIPTIFGPVF